MNHPVSAFELPIMRSLSEQVIVAAAPEEQEIARAMTDDLITQYEKGFVTAAETEARDSAGHGEIDLVTLVVVPLVVAVSQKLLEGLVGIGLNNLREYLNKRAQEDPSVIKQFSNRVEKVVEEEYTVIEQHVKSKKARRRQKLIKQTTIRVVRRYIGLEG
jgi:hypothetical protein